MLNSKAPLKIKRLLVLLSGILLSSVLQADASVGIGPLDLRFGVVDHFRKGNAEARTFFIEHHDFSASDNPAVDHHIDRLSDPPVEGDDGATPQFRQLKDRHRRSTEQDFERDGIRNTRSMLPPA